MTCREFIEAAESLNPLQLRLMETSNEPMSAHGRECAGCGKWLESQKFLGSALQALRTDTAQREASPKVELALLEAFRTQGFEPVATVAPHRAAPAVWKLSRFFEVGAYAAVAAALIVGIFLGARMWRDRQVPTKQVQAQEMPARPVISAATIADHDKSSERLPNRVAQKSATSTAIKSATAPAMRPQTTEEQTASTTVDRQGFVALMFCDPLICSGDEQVIRMELPGNTSASAEGIDNQPVIADVVVGDDGLVRAMRIVN
jgi:hypothetical protein